MGRAADSKTFLAVAAALMAGLVIATMLAINAKLQSALAPTVDQAGAPAVKMIPPAGPPLLQSTAAPSIANSDPNSGSNSGLNSLNNSSPATPHLVASPRPRAVAPAVTNPPAAIVPAPPNAAHLATPAAPPAPPTVPPAPVTPAAPTAGTQPATAPTPPEPAPAVLPTVTPVPVPVVIVGGSPPAIPPVPNLSAAATTTVTVAPDEDLGDREASTGETHQGPRRDRKTANPDLTAAPTGPDPAADPEISVEESDGNVGHHDGDDDPHPHCPGHGPDRADEDG